ncbi:MAG: polysaccharide deacetylase family protein [Frankiaceae bacterium]
MRRRQVLTGLAALGVATVADAAIAPTPPMAAGHNAGTREIWPETGAGNARVEVTFRVRTARRALALTFDDGPDPRWTPQVIELLARHGATATFFVVGERAARHPALLRRVAAAGHAIGNHTYIHADLTGVSATRAAAEVTRTSDTVAEIIGVRPTLLRPPYGHLDPVALLAAAEAGLDVVLWSQHVRGSDPDADAALCRRDVRPGSIVLAHDGGPTPNAALFRTLSGLVGDLRADGYALVGVPTLLSTATAT